MIVEKFILCKNLGATPKLGGYCSQPQRITAIGGVAPIAADINIDRGRTLTAIDSNCVVLSRPCISGHFEGMHENAAFPLLKRCWNAREWRSRC
jgi:hypothetical protein